MVKQGISFKRSAIAHELGHLYGLQERYIDQPSTYNNPSELSVMDMPVYDLQEGPTLVDKTRVRAFWGKSDYVYENGILHLWQKGDLSITGTAYQDYDTGVYIAAFTWRDLAWAEQTHAVGFWYSANGTNWEYNPFYSKDHMTDIGLHLYLGGDRVDLGDRTMEEYIIPRDWKPAGWVKMCSSPYFVGVQEWGSFRCSNAVYIP